MIGKNVQSIYYVFIYFLLIHHIECLTVPEKKSNLTLEPIFNKIELRSSLKQLNNTSTNNSTSEVKPSACSCGGGLCSCCSRVLYDTWKQKACVEVTYEPDEFSFTAKILLNGRVMYTRTVSGKNPRPICIPLPRIPGVRACARFYNIYFQGRNIHLCVNLEGKFGDTTLVKMGFDCLRLGANGVALVKPEDGTGLGQVEFLPDTYDDNYDDNNDDGDDSDDDDDDDDDDSDNDDY